MSIYLGTNLISGTQDISGKANTSLNNLDVTGKNIGNWSSNVTNCITEIPQDIKMELSGGTYTLKAGSKVCVPNGFDSDGTTPKFDIIEIENDLSVSSITNVNMFIYYDLQNNVLRSASANSSGSGTVVPSSTGLFYNTSTNLIDMYNYGNANGYIGSFPLCKNFCNDTTKKSIDQIFNGFGYIGSTVFALPGVKGLIPDGRNEDGTLKSIPVEITSVTTGSRNLTGDGIPIWLKSDGTLAFSSGLTYDEETNTNPETYLAGDKYVQIGSCSMASGVISNFATKRVFHALDWNDIGNICDGDFVKVSTTIVTNVSLNGSSALSYTLSDLPNDGKKYMALIWCNLTTGTTSGNSVACSLSSDIAEDIDIARAQTRTSSSVSAMGATWIPISSSRKIYIARGTNQNGTCSLYLRGYRRIGTNQ